MTKLKKRADGRLVKTVTAANGKRLFFYGKTEREINKKILEYRDKEDKGKTFLEVSDDWWEEAEERLAVQSIQTYKKAKSRADGYFKDTPIKDITPKDVSGFLSSVAAYGYAQRTVAKQKVILGLIFSHGIEKDALMFNPCASVRLPKGLPKVKRESATLEDEKKIRESVDVWLFPFFALMTGMRKGELLALTWRDVDFENNIIHVTKSVYRDGNQGFIKEPKTASGVRIVPLLKPLREKLLEIKKRMPDDFIFSDDGKRPFTDSRFRSLVAHFKKVTGVQATAHQLRHSFATIAFEAGISAKAVQEILGHSQVTTTLNIYTDFRKKSFEQVTDVLNKRMI